jgi:probable HAF family extracellular repeat protein
MTTLPAFTKLLLVSRRKGALAVCLGLCMLGLGRAHALTTFDAPCAGTSATQGTLAFSINPAGTIVGFCRDTNDVRHAFLRAPNGTITTFDVPGAGAGAGGHARLQR